MDTEADKWEKIVQVHNHAKALILLAEELDPEHTFFLPPVIQQRDALDHVVRAKYAGLHPGTRADPAQYALDHLDKALAHEYRAFFDIADWLSILYREKIASALSDYSHEAILAALPDFYTTVYPKFETIYEKVAAVRGAKDIGNETALIDDVEKYRDIIGELSAMWAKIVVSVGAINSSIRSKERFRNTQQPKPGRRRIRDVLFCLLGAAVGIAAVSIFCLTKQ